MGAGKKFLSSFLYSGPSEFAGLSMPGGWLAVFCFTFLVYAFDDEYTLLTGDFEVAGKFFDIEHKFGISKTTP